MKLMMDLNLLILLVALSTLLKMKLEQIIVEILEI